MSDTRVVFHEGALDALLRSSSGEVARDIKRRATRVRDRAYELCAKRSGELAGSIEVREVEVDTKGPSVAVGTDKEYAIYVERGTRHMAAQPFLEPALQAAID